MSKLTLIEAGVLLLLCSSFSVGLVWADCDTNSEITELSPCLPFASGQVAAPSQSCCAAVKSLATEPPCLCELLAYLNSSTLPSTYNLSSFLSTVPAVCHVDLPAAGCASSPASSPLPFAFPSGPVPGPLAAKLVSNASRTIPGTILSILQFAAAPALLSLVLRAY